MPVITPGQKTRCQAITDVITSVSMAQSALSHILNAEGEKLQTIAGLPDVSPEELLKANRSVERTVRNISQMELILHSKLETFSGCLCTCSPLAQNSCGAVNG